jgi:hypothetical protein
VEKKTDWNDSFEVDINRLAKYIPPSIAYLVRDSSRVAYFFSNLESSNLVSIILDRFQLVSHLSIIWDFVLLGNALFAERLISNSRIFQSRTALDVTVNCLPYEGAKPFLDRLDWPIDCEGIQYSLRNSPLEHVLSCAEISKLGKIGCVVMASVEAEMNIFQAWSLVSQSSKRLLRLGYSQFSKVIKICCSNCHAVVFEILRLRRRISHGCLKPVYVRLVQDVQAIAKFSPGDNITDDKSDDVNLWLTPEGRGAAAQAKKLDQLVWKITDAIGTLESQLLTSLGKPSERLISSASRFNVSVANVMTELVSIATLAESIDPNRLENMERLVNDSAKSVLQAIAIVSDPLH